MRSSKIIVFILSILLTVPPFFGGGDNVFIRGMVFVLAGLAGLLFVFGLKIAGRFTGRPTLTARTVMSRFAAWLHIEYGASEASCKNSVKVAGDLNPLTPPFKGGVVFIFLFLYLLFGLITVFFSVSPYHSAVFWLESLSYAVLFLVVAKIKLEKKEIDWLIKIFLGVSLILCLAGIYFYIAGSYSRLTSLFWWPNPFAGYLLFALFFGIDWVLRDQKKDVSCHCEEPAAGDEAISTSATTEIATLRRGGFARNDSKIFPILFLSIILSSFILTGSRGAFLSFLIVLPIYFYFKYWRFARGATPPHPIPLLSKERGRAPLIRGGGGIIKILAAALLSLVLVFIINNIKNDSFGFFEHIKTSGTQSDLSSGIRLKYWQGALEMFKERPLAGWGVRTFGTVYHIYQKDPISSGKYVHNLYLEMMAEQGIFTAIFFVLFLIFVLFSLKLGKSADKLLSFAIPHQTSPNPSLVRRGSFKFPHSPYIKGCVFNGDRFSISLFCALLAFLLHNGVDIDWHFSASVVVFWIFLGLLYNVSRENPPQPPFIRGALSNVLLIKGDKGGFIKWALVFFSIILIFSGIILFRADYYYEQGIKYKKENKLAEAEIAFQKSLFLNPNPNYLRELGIILYSRAINIGGEEERELLNKAKEISQKIIKYDSYNALNYELLGRIYFAKKNFKEAEKNFKEAVILNQFNPKHCINLSSLLISEGRKEEAKEIINLMLSYYPEETINNRKVYIMADQEITSGIEKDIEYLKYLLNNI